MSTAIEWTDETWNPTTGCDRVSPGCDNCYALGMAKRLKAMGSAAYQEDGDPRTSGPGFALQVHQDRLDQPLRWTKPRRIFVNSMSDLFHPRVPDEFIARVFATMAAAPHHTFQVLTKRPKRMRALLDLDGQRLLEATTDEATATALYSALWPLPNVWLGTSVEDQQRADERIPALLDTNAAVRFLSMEPLLGPVDLSWWIPDASMREHSFTSRIHWVIVGGESGPGARPMHPWWVRALRDQCTAAGVAFFFKQWGAWSEMPRAIGDRIDAAVAHDGCHHERPDVGDPAYRRWALEHDHTRPNRMHAMYRVGKHAAGRELDDRTWDEFPEAVTADA